MMSRGIKLAPVIYEIAFIGKAKFIKKHNGMWAMPGGSEKTTASFCGWAVENGLGLPKFSTEVR